jgi:hypothetical protein
MDLKIKQEIDNYVLAISMVLAAVAATIQQTEIAFMLISIGAIIKAIFSAIDPNYKVLSWDNADNIILATAGVLATLTTLTDNILYSTVIMVVGYICKSVGSAIVRGGSTAVNMDNVILAFTTALSAGLMGLGPVIGINFTEYVTYITIAGAFLKGVTSTYFRNKAAT